jgi:hypothetical protein
MKQLFCIIIIFTAVSLAAEITHPLTKRKISFDSGYINNLNTNRAIGNFGLESYQAFSAQFEYLLLNTAEGEGLAKYYLRYFMFLVGEYVILYNPYALTYHEYGHFSRSKAYGGNPTFHYMKDDAYRFEGSTGYTDFWTYYKRGYSITYDTLFNRNAIGGGYVNTDSYSGVDYENEHRENFTRKIYQRAGGLNNQAYLAELIEDDIYFRGGTVAYMWTYIYQKLAPLMYVRYAEKSLGEGTGDIYNIITLYDGKGYNITRGDIQLYSGLSLLLSSTTYMLIGNWYLYIIGLQKASENTQNLNALEYEGFKIPDLAFYFTDRGLTYKLKSGYRFDSGDYIIPFAVEFVVKGDQAVEPSVGVIRVFDGYTAGGNLIFNTAMDDPFPVGFDLSAEYFLFEKRAGISAGLVHYNGSTYFGKRNHPDYAAGIRYNELWVRASLYY